MKDCTLAFTGFLLCILSSISSNQLYAQWQPVHDANGKVITGGGRTYDEARRKAEQEKIQREAAEERRKNTYNTTNSIQSKSNSANARKADHPDYGKYDFRGTVDDNGLRIVFLKEKWGLVSKDDKEILPLVYDRVVYKGDGWYEIISGTKSGFADKNGHEVIPCQFDFIESIFNSEGLATVRKNGSTYFINKEGKAALSSKQNYVYHGFGNRYVEGLVCVSLKDITGKEKYGFLDSNGILKIPLIYDNALNFHNGMAYVQIGASWGTIDKDGKVVVPIAYYKLNSTGDLFIASTWKDNFGVIDRTGAVMIPHIYEASGRFSEGCIKMKFKGQWGFVDSVSGKEITPFIYNSANDFSEGLAAVAKRDDLTYEKYGFINKAGEEIIPFVYQKVINGFTQGLAGVLQNGYWGFIDKNQKTTIPFIYSDARPFSEGLAAVQLKGKWGFVDKAGKIVIPLKYDDTYSQFIDGIITVKIGEKWGCINNKGEEVIAFLHNNPVNFYDGEARVYIDGKEVYINKKGIIVASAKRIRYWVERIPVVAYE